MTSTFVVYIDESGDEGFAFGKGSSEWFILSAVITRKASDLETVKLVDRVRVQLEKPGRKPLHFRDLRHEHRLPFIDTVASANLKTVSVLVHKPTLKEPEKFQERYRLYFYTARYLFERVSWYCRDHRTNQDAGDGSADIVFSNRSGMSYEDMRKYFDHLKAKSGYFDTRIEWNIIKPEQIAAFSSGKRMGLQIADAVAGSFFYAVESTRHGFTEDRYARMLKQTVYHHRGQYRGYGIKFWPREVENCLDTDERLKWVNETYK